MIPRKPLAPNNRTAKSLVREFRSSEALYVQYPKNNERASVFNYARRGRPGSEGAFGGGRVVGK
jgi:hypothetical protein